MVELSIPKPFLKWAGGKTQLADEIIARRPLRFNTYLEPFLGSGAIFFKLYRAGFIKKAILSDINAELIDTYIAIRDQAREVIKLLSEFPYNKDFYYYIRSKNPWSLSLAERAARMIYLNKTGYNGLYRVNRKGQFNVPFGRYKSPKYCDIDNLMAVSNALQNVEILKASFEIVLKKAKPGDWVYFDPPYVPISSTSNFTAYSPEGFDLKSQEKLRDVCIELSLRNVYFTLSNSDTELVRSLYKSYYFEIDEVWATRAINCNGSKRGKIKELVITNFPVTHAVQMQLLEKNVPYLVLYNNLTHNR